jgi:hypothetical protein
MPELLKIGYTEASLDQRLSQLRHTAIPTDFKVETAFHVQHPAACERAVHKALEQFRHTPQREFFRITLKVALNTVWPIIQDYLAEEKESITEPKAAAHSFPDLSETEEEIFLTIIDRPHDLAIDWSWIRSEHNFTENEARYYLQELKAKGYLKEMKDRNPKYDSDWDLAEKGLKYYMSIKGREK